jgi:negative regulator of flagellin synthesis FlgM
MAEKIDGYGRGSLDVSPSRARSVARTDRQAEAGTSRKAEAAQDAVQLTDTAAHLKRIEAHLANVPDVDRARVEAIRQRIEAGAYAVDAARVAQKLLRLEQDLT